MTVQGLEPGVLWCIARVDRFDADAAEDSLFCPFLLPLLEGFSILCGPVSFLVQHIATGMAVGQHPFCSLDRIFGEGIVLQRGETGQVVGDVFVFLN